MLEEPRHPVADSQLRLGEPGLRRVLRPVLHLPRRCTSVRGSLGRLCRIGILDRRTFSTLLGGRICDVLWRRIGARRACRLACTVALLAAGVLLVAGSLVTDATAAVILLSCSFAGFMFTDAIYWAAATQLGGRHTPVATGILNTSGSLIGVVNAPFVPMLAERFGWVFAMASGALFASAARLLWRGCEPTGNSATAPEPSRSAAV